MERKWIWRVVFASFLIILAVAASVTTVVDKPSGKDGKDPLPEFLRDWFPGINLGLDLQGGLRLIYEVEVEAAVEDKRNHVADAIVDTLAEKGEITGVKIKRS